MGGDFGDGMLSIEDGALHGNIAIRHREGLRESVGGEAFRASLVALAEEHRSAVLSATPSGWVPVEAMQALYDAVARQVSRTPEELQFEIGSAIVERNVRSLWRMLLRLTSDAQLISQASILYSKTWNRGILEARLRGSGRASMTISNWPDIPAFTVRGVRTAIQTTMTALGRQDIRIATTENSEGVRYDIEWTRG